jgi:hypothetical protein
MAEEMGTVREKGEEKSWNKAKLGPNGVKTQIVCLFRGQGRRIDEKPNLTVKGLENIHF